VVYNRKLSSILGVDAMIFVYTALVSFFAVKLIIFVLKKGSKASLLDANVGRYQVRQFIPSMIALVAVVIHVFTFGIGSNAPPRIGSTRLTDAISAHYGDSLTEQRIDMSNVGVLGVTDLSSTIREARRDLRRVDFPLPRLQQLHFADVLNLPFPSITVPLDVDMYWLELRRSSIGIDNALRERFIASLAQNEVNVSNARKLEYQYSLRCDPIRQNCTVLLPTPLARQHSTRFGLSENVETLIAPHLQLVQRDSGDQIRASILTPNLVNTGTSVSLTVGYYPDLDIPSFDILLSKGSQPRTEGDNPSFLNLPVSTPLTGSDFTLRVDMLRVQGTPVLFTECMAAVKVRFEDFGGLDDFEDRATDFCTVPDDLLQNISVLRCVGDGPVRAPDMWDGPRVFDGPRVCAGAKGYSPAASIIRPNRLVAHPEINFETAADDFRFDRDNDHLFLGFMDSIVAGHPTQDIPDELRKKLLNDIVSQYIAVLGPTEHSPALLNYLSDFGRTSDTDAAYLFLPGSPIYDAQIARSENAEEIIPALAAQMQLIPYYRARVSLGPVIFEDLFKKLHILGLCNNANGHCTES
jgi:hypothetical protein